ncbi:MAG TPA: molybdate ABC transporter substrate-binding protein [Longimicrobiaceae bacterium]|nr:molybdate ABC transporter substrate-binding protein [Longimicrobiaceae bacterium]
MRLFSRVPLLVLCLLALPTGCGFRSSAPPEIVVAAASDLTFAFRELGERFEEETGTRVVFTFGSSGQLAQQILHGAPVDLFASANLRFVDELQGAGRLVPGTRAVYARGYLVLWTRADAIRVPERTEELAQPEFRRIAIANPQHAPYGVAAREALQSARLWEALQPRLVYGENIRQTLQFAESGNADVAIVALALALATEGRWTQVPEQLHQPLDQALAVVRGSANEAAARRFAALVTGEEGRAVLRRYGFGIPRPPSPGPSAARGEGRTARPTEAQEPMFGRMEFPLAPLRGEGARGRGGPGEDPGEPRI